MNDDSCTSSLRPGLEGHATAVVTEAMTAPALGSGTIAVYATPSLAALMERAAVDCVESLLRPGQATLGVRLEMSHTAPTPTGVEVSARAQLTAVEDRTLRFAITARDAASVIGEALHTRVVVDTARFAAKLAARRTDP
jgi:predicted thioesterase